MAGLPDGGASAADDHFHRTRQWRDGRSDDDDRRFHLQRGHGPECDGSVFYDPSFNFTPTTPSWSAGNTVLTCTPVPTFPADKLITWVVSGQDPVGTPLGGIPTGTFTTGTGGGGGGSGTNAITTFSVGKVHHYNQTSTGSPTLDPITPYGFSGVTALSSNRTATSVALTLPTGAVSNLTHLPPPSAEIFIMSPFDTSLNTYDATFPPGNYSFFVQASTNQTVVVNLPTTATMPQPGAPHLTNYLAAQAVDPNQSFVLGWDAFPGGTAADYIDVDIGAAYGSPNPGLPGALTGTARTFTIPAGTLQPDSTYLSRVGFFRHVGTTNANYATAAYRATYGVLRDHHRWSGNRPVDPDQRGLCARQFQLRCALLREPDGDSRVPHQPDDRAVADLADHKQSGQPFPGGRTAGGDQSLPLFPRPEWNVGSDAGRTNRRAATRFPAASFR